MPKGEFTKTRDSIITLRAVVRDGKLAELLDPAGVGIGEILTTPGKKLSGVPQILGKSGVPIGIPPSGYVGANGALTLGTLPAATITFTPDGNAGASKTITATGGTPFAATDVDRVLVMDGGKLAKITAFTSSTVVTATITTTLSATAFAPNAWQLSNQLVGDTTGSPFYPAGVYSAGCYLYFPSGAVYAGSQPGFYWTVMSSVCVGTIYDNRASGLQKAPTTPTPIVAAGPGAYTSPITAVQASIVSVPGGCIGPNGTLHYRYGVTCANNANNKSVSTKLGAANVQGVSFASSRGRVTTTSVQNRNSQQSQVSWDSSAGDVGANVGGLNFGSTDTSIDTTASVYLTLSGSANDFIMLDSFEVTSNFH